MSKNKKAIAQFTLADATEVFFEIPEPSEGEPEENVAVGDEVYKMAEGAFEKAIDKVGPVAGAVMSRIRQGLPDQPDEVEVKLGFNLTAGGGVVFSSVESGVSFEVTLKWVKNSP